MSDPLYEKIYAFVRQVPHGRVTTYGVIAKIVGGCTARIVGYAMAATPEGSQVPWQRVINAQGKISPRGYGSAVQRQLLEEEGVVFDAANKVDMGKFGWPDGEYSSSRSNRQESLFPDL